MTDVDDVARVMREAFHIATTGRPGPVLVDLPKNVQIGADRARLRCADEFARLSSGVVPGEAGANQTSGGGH